jgi:UDP-glucose 4-epimerase
VRILVTGSSGHVGGAIAEHLMQEGHEVIGLSRRVTKRNRLLSGAVAADIGQPDLIGSLDVERLRCEAVVHAAAALDKDPHALSISLTNGVGTQQVLELAARWQVSSFVYLSSVPVIGRPRQLPIDEAHPTDPVTAYHASKLYGEHLVGVAALSGMPAVSLRLTAPVGPGMPDGRILSVFVRRALAGEALELAGEGTRLQDYVDVRDIARAAQASLERRATGVLNIGSGRPVSNLELAQRCVAAVGSRSEVRLSGVPDPEEGLRWEVSIARAAEVIDYSPRQSIDDSINAVADDIRAAEKSATTNA